MTEPPSKTEISLDDLEINLDEVLSLKEMKIPFRHLAPEEIWTPIARVLIIQITLCTCGARFEAPGAKTLLIRNENVRSKTIWEHEMEIANKSLPLERREMVSNVQVCQNCAKEKEDPAEIFDKPSSTELH